MLRCNKCKALKMPFTRCKCQQQYTEEASPDVYVSQSTIYSNGYGTGLGSPYWASMPTKWSSDSSSSSSCSSSDSSSSYSSDSGSSSSCSTD